MARPAGSKAGLDFLYLPLFLWLCETLADTHSLYYNFTLKPKSGSEQPWCEVQGWIHGNMFLHYHCGSGKARLFGPLGTKLNTIQTWEGQTETLKHLMEELRKKLLDLKSGIFTKNAAPILWGRMKCHCKADGRSSGSWWFGFSGPPCLFFDSENGNWTVVRSGGRLLKETLHSDREVTALLTRIPNGDRKSWLEQVLVIRNRTLEMTDSEIKTSWWSSLCGTMG
uniref:MHC class I-like antigen recognition-like domain-containing protein n=1 Tax=Catagonus wagneri TaxID=51154 RepID=A0A8C3VIH4_9CETA